MIKTFKQKHLKKLFETGKSPKVGKRYQDRLLIVLDMLEASIVAEDMNSPGSDFHQLKGKLKDFYSVAASGNWKLIFRFEEGDAYDVEFIDYH